MEDCPAERHSNLLIIYWEKNKKMLDHAIVMVQHFLLCAEHGTNLAGASPVTGIYRQV